MKNVIAHKHNGSAKNRVDDAYQNEFKCNPIYLYAKYFHFGLEMVLFMINNQNCFNTYPAFPEC